MDHAQTRKEEHSRERKQKTALNWKKNLELLVSRTERGDGNGNPLQYSCLENSMDGGARWAAVHAIAKSRTRLSDFTFTFHFHTLEKEMSTHSSVPAWRIPGMEETGGLPSIGSHRVRHNWCNLAAAAAKQKEEKAMAPHSSTLAWKIPWTEEPGRLQSMGSLRIGHDWATSLSFFTFRHWRSKWQHPPVFLPGESQGQGSLVGCRLWGRTESETTEVT